MTINSDVDNMESTRPKTIDSIMTMLLEGMNQKSDGEQHQSSLLTFADDKAFVRFCLEDVRQDYDINQIVRICKTFNELVGKKIKDVRLMNIPDAITNTRATIATLEIRFDV